MNWKWFPWQYLVKRAARKRGFLDPIKIISQTQNFVQPSEVAAPVELLRLGVVLHARGLMNSLAIVHNRDWIWPFWVECQYNPLHQSFIPRAFSLTQINLTHRNWTAVGIPGCEKYPIVDPRGLVTPHYDGWSIDAWIISDNKAELIPARLDKVKQELGFINNLHVTTESVMQQMVLTTRVEVIGTPQKPLCRMEITGVSPNDAWLVISLRPYNPEGVSFINNIELLKDCSGWKVNGKQHVYLSERAEQYEFSYYSHGDVYSRLPSQEDKDHVSCKVGMATAAALYRLKAGKNRVIVVEMPLAEYPFEKEVDGTYLQLAKDSWDKSLEGSCALQVPDDQFQFLFEAALRTMILHAPKEVYPGPFLYRRFWFRDSAFILKAMLCAGFKDRVAMVLDCFRHKQTRQGYFLSQEGEWDSNGEALWIMHQYCLLTGNPPPEEWRESIIKGGRWIHEKLLPIDSGLNHAGLLPAGFSAEHFGPNDFYYWDDFWAVAGLNAAASLCEKYRDKEEAAHLKAEANKLAQSIDKSLAKVSTRLKRLAVPASPYRRLDTAAIGPLVVSYPLRLWNTHDPRLTDTVDFIMNNCLIKNAFFHDIAHSGINPYLTLDLAQVLLRMKDSRYFEVIKGIADLASSTGQWPEAIHPQTGNGCMGDGQHVWAAAEWVMMLRNCFVREEGNRLILCSGIPKKWLDKKEEMFFGPAPTEFGTITITISIKDDQVFIRWIGVWFSRQPSIEISFPGLPTITIDHQVNEVVINLRDNV